MFMSLDLSNNLCSAALQQLEPGAVTLLLILQESVLQEASMQHLFRPTAEIYGKNGRNLNRALTNKTFRNVVLAHTLQNKCNHCTRNSSWRFICRLRRATIFI